MAKKFKGKRSQVKVFLVYMSVMLVCMLIFGAAALFLMDRFVTQPALDRDREEQEALGSEQGSQPLIDYSLYRKTYLFVGADGQDINAMALIRFTPDEGGIEVVPVSELTLSRVGETSGTLQALYESGGMNYLKSAVESTFSVSCDSYIKISNDGWKSLVEYTGGVTSYSFPEELYYKDEESGELTSFSEGTATRTLWGDDIRRIMTYPNYSGGEQARLQVIGELTVSLLNNAFTAHAEDVNSNLQNIFNAIFNNSDTNITTRSFNDVRPAYEYLLDGGYTSATYRIPRGSYDSNGFFTVDPEFIAELSEYFGFTEAEPAQ